MKRAVFVVLSILEVVAIFVAVVFAMRALTGLDAVASYQVAWPPSLFDLAFRWTPLILAALVVDLALRRRGLVSWGLVGTHPFDPMAAARLLVLGGLAPLALTYFQPPAQSAWSANGSDPLALAAAFAIPLLGQELFVTGYARRRFADHAPAWLVVVLVMAFFVLAHAQHASNGILGAAFLAAMAWQGLWWAIARRAGVSLLTLMTAHLALLIAYEHPLWGLVAVGALAVLIAFGAPGWIAKLWQSREEERA